jgi:hypothetical protein
MKKLLLSLCVTFCFATLEVTAQNVGIGETAPTAMKLQVKAADSAVALIQNATTSGSNVKTGLFFKTGNNYSGSIGTIGSGATFRMGLFTYGGATPTSLIERISISDGGNVGIGKTIPLEKLDVNGDLKADTILPTAIRMTPNAGDGKVLTSDALGNGTWQSLGSKAGYKYCKQINGGAGSFTIPAGVTEIMVELWGAGSGGILNTTSTSFVLQGQYFGGSSGGYASTVQTVVPGYNLSYNIGSGSSSHAYNVNGTDGGSSTVIFASGNLIALGGKGHVVTSFESSGVQSGSSSLPNYTNVYGNSGGFPTFKSEQTTSTDFWKIVTTGDGGKPVGFLNTQVQKGATVYFLNNSFQYYNTETFSVSNYPSSGGASTPYTSSGGDGMLLIWYN